MTRSPLPSYQRALRRLPCLLLALCGAMAHAAATADVPATPTPTTAAPAARVAIPAPARLKYTIYGQVSHLPYRASGELLWRHDGRNYEAQLEVSLFLLGSRTQSSRGRITPDGLQPLHFNDRVHNDRTVDFDYREGLIRFSEGTPPAPLPAGAQDHLSVFMQLGSLIGAAPQRYPAGTEVTLPAMGIYGPETWHFVVAGPEALRLPGGEQATVKVTRTATRADEPNADLWLAPALGWLPARIRLWQDNGDVIDQRWRASEAP